MRTAYAWILVGLLAYQKAGPQASSSPPPEPVVAQAPAAKFAQPPPPAPAPPPPAPTPPPAPPTPPPPPPPPAPPVKVAKVTLQMTAATLADDCGGGAEPPPPEEESARKSKHKSAQFAKADRACDQSSMQLSIKASSGDAATKLTVKRVELYDDKETRIAVLSARRPTIWTKDGMYKSWDQKVAPGNELSVSYELTQPPWGTVSNRRNQTYVLKAVVTVGGGDQTVKRDVHISAPTSLPPGVKT